MKATKMKILVFGLIISMVFGFTALALAHGWRGHGPMMDYDDGAGMGPGYHMGYGGQMGWQSSLTPEQVSEVQRLRAAFYRSTSGLRQDIYQKQAAIADELAKESPDRARIEKLQDDVARLRVKLDRQRLDFQLKVKKIAPNAGAGFGRGFGPGHGPGAGMGPGYCWAW